LRIKKVRVKKLINYKRLILSPKVIKFQQVSSPVIKNCAKSLQFYTVQPSTLLYISSLKPCRSS
jgi:hypothetical protein